MKISNNKAAFATFYVDDKNKKRWWRPTATPENPLVEVFLPLTVMLPGAFSCHADRGYTPYTMWKATGEMAGEASAGISEEDIALIQD